MILAFIAVGAFFVNPDNWHPFIPEPTGVENQFGIDGVIRAATIVFFAYIGFEAVSTAGQEAKNPRKDMPIGILGSLIICTVLYMAHRRGAHRRGVVHQAQRRRARGHRGRHLRPAMGLAGQVHQDRRHRRPVVGGAGADVRPDARVLFHVARRPAAEGARARCIRSSRRRGSTRSSSACWCRCAAAVFDINQLGDLTSVGTLVAFGLVCFSVIWLRSKRPDLPRHFKVWGYPVIPAHRRRLVLRARLDRRRTRTSACGSSGSCSRPIGAVLRLAATG